jgi:hypothetical protein
VIRPLEGSRKRPYRGDIERICEDLSRIDRGKPTRVHLVAFAADLRVIDHVSASPNFTSERLGRSILGERCEHVCEAELNLWMFAAHLVDDSLESINEPLLL